MVNEPLGAQLMFQTNITGEHKTIHCEPDEGHNEEGPPSLCASLKVLFPHMYFATIRVIFPHH